MNAATSSDSIPLPREGGANGTAAGESPVARAGVVSVPLGAILTLFWVYVALSNVLYARGMSLSMDPDGTRHFFADWHARVLQHVALYPALFGCVWVSLRIGWRPWWRAFPIQLALGLAFATLASPVLSACEWLVGEGKLHSANWTFVSFYHAIRMEGPGDVSMWISSITSFLLTYGFALALVTGFALYRRFKESELRSAALERAWSGARLAALRMQLSPHTLFNLLHTIRGQIGWDPAAARQMIVQLGDLLRRLLAAGERDLAPLSDELEFVRLYLELQQQRFADRLRLEMPAAGSLPHTWVPSLILQPLVENAVSHGLADHSEPVLIRVSGSVRGDMLSLRVTNTMASGAAAQRRERGGSSEHGIGLRNVRERLAVHFGDRARLEAGPVERGGHTSGVDWIAEIRMPLSSVPSST